MKKKRYTEKQWVIVIGGEPGTTPYVAYRSNNDTREGCIKSELTQCATNIDWPKRAMMGAHCVRATITYELPVRKRR